jgi:hypothetical protein
VLTVPDLSPGVGDGAVVTLLSSSPHPLIVIVTAASMANALPTVNSRRVKELLSLILTFLAP